MAIEGHWKHFSAILLLIQCNEKMKDNKTALTLLFENVD